MREVQDIPKSRAVTLKRGFQVARVPSLLSSKLQTNLTGWIIMHVDPIGDEMRQHHSLSTVREKGFPRYFGDQPDE